MPRAWTPPPQRGAAALPGLPVPDHGTRGGVQPVDALRH
ncbi:hypothetical protein ZEAMMB73_Zm00001d030909 [Zea mays]|uniref:Uncharacterized protein n=1 Tax=Zea mays TaxID=4577 RepID=A0A1D6KEY9_MAIZE|nr:hypothetical protein ZEAMMB73_Zm00001d030909 [Zea mays]